MAYTLSVALQTDGAGQTLTATLVDTNGNDVGSAIATGFHDLGAGFYMWTYAAFPDGFRGVVKFMQGSTPKTIVSINPQEAEYLDVKVSSRAPAGGHVAVTWPVADDGRVELVRGDDYLAAEGRDLRWAAVGWPNLAGATINFTARRRGGNDIMTAVGSVLTSSSNPDIEQEVSVSLPSATTASLRLGTYGYDVQATLASSGHIITLALSSLVLLEDMTHA